jgi:hypothetical protein
MLPLVVLRCFDRVLVPVERKSRIQQIFATIRSQLLTI